ncbi:hypothetical protein AC579_8019 [Pseudocercospora musae]|uniref:Uncharacterized protein n=1 Tax=Pseudocercospora musae TaxID=113226 RepID=A0A139IPX1_9PEZI|nr:hypothetical protein AC579_8019 [Pseudocercospora musae]
MQRWHRKAATQPAQSVETTTTNAKITFSASHFVLALNYFKANSSRISVIKASPGKGNGIFAWQAINAAATIFVHKVILQLPDTCITEQTIIARAFSKLSLEDQQRFFELHENHRPYISKVFRIFKANAFGDKDDSKVYDRISRLNHSCVPNGSKVNRFDSREHYCSNAHFERRRDYDILRELVQLWMYFGFRCHCPACSLEHKEQWISDTRRRLINPLFHFLHGKSAPDLSIMEALTTTMTPQQAERPEFLAMVDHHGAPLQTTPTRAQILAYNVLYAKLMEAEGLLGMDVAEAYAAAIVELRRKM